MRTKATNIARLSTRFAPAPATMNQRWRAGMSRGRWGRRPPTTARPEEQEQRCRRADARSPGHERQRAHAGVVGVAGDRSERAEAHRGHDDQRRPEAPPLGGAGAARLAGVIDAPRLTPARGPRWRRRAPPQGAARWPRAPRCRRGRRCDGRRGRGRGPGRRRSPDPPVARWRRSTSRARRPDRLEPARAPGAAHAFVRPVRSAPRLLACDAPRRRGRNRVASAEAATVPRGVARAPSVAPRVSISTPRLAA